VMSMLQGENKKEDGSAEGDEARAGFFEIPRPRRSDS
jgi:hypothetical protein